MSKIERQIIDGLREFADALKSGDELGELFTCSKVVLDLDPKEYGPEEVKATRKLLRASQAIFAKLLGVSARTVQAWERGANRPNDMACRFMDEIQRNPDYWRRRLLESASKRPAANSR